MTHPLFAVVVIAILGACSSDSSTAAKPQSSSTAPSTVSTTTTSGGPNQSPCGATTAPPTHYDSVVVFSFENRSWDDVGAGFGPAMPYLHELGTKCSWFPDWTETDRSEKSLAQYLGQVIGTNEPTAVDDCKPSETCRTTQDSIFRQLRLDGRRAVNYVEGATAPCSDEGNKPKHIPALYLWGADDRAHCVDQVRPFRDFDPNHLPAFAFVTPTQCNDGHDCSDQTVDTWARDHVQPVLDSAAYRAGKVAVFIWYDESAPVPNLWITPTAAPGARDGIAAGPTGTLRAWQSMLGISCLQGACTATDLRPAAHS